MKGRKQKISQDTYLQRDRAEPEWYARGQNFMWISENNFTNVEQPGYGLLEKMCVVADRGMISQDTVEAMEAKGMNYIIGVRMRRVNHVKRDVLTRAGRYQEVLPEVAH